MNKTNLKNRTTIDWAKEYLNRGFAPIPVKANAKEPIISNWPKAEFTEEDLHDHFDHSQNIGIVLGDRSNGLVDVDLDCPEALLLSDGLLPKTGIIFGRKSRPGSHRAYLCKDAERHIAFKHPSTKEVLVELRANGHQTVFPGSKVLGELVEFDVDELPAQISWAELQRSASLLATGCLLVRCWNEGNRHDLSLAVAGTLASAGCTRQEAEQLVQAICQAAHDDDVADRMNSVRTTFEKFESSRAVKGFKALAAATSEAIANSIWKWVAPEKPIAEEQVPLDSMALQSDASAAVAFADRMSRTLLYCGATDSWYLRNNSVHRKVGKQVVQGLAMEFLREVAAGAYVQIATKLESRNRINAVADLCRHHLAVESDQIDADLMLAGCKDGTVIDLFDLSVVERPSTVITKTLGTSLDPKAECPVWTKFLNRIFEGHQEVITFLQRAVGYTLTGRVDEQCLFLLLGDGSNGKSTFLNVLQQLFGDYAGNTPMHSLTVQRSEQTYDLASLVGKRFVSAIESEVGQKLAEARVKSITGGDPVTCRPIYKEQFTYQPQFKLWLATNNLPRIDNPGIAIWRRICLVKFPVTINEVERDGTLGDRLAQELPGILNWAIEGLRAYRKEGLNPPASMRAEKDLYKAHSDSVQQFIETCCGCSSYAKTTAKTLYDSYKSWCENSNIDPVSKQMFGKTLGGKGYVSKKGRAGNSWIGLRLVD